VRAHAQARIARAWRRSIAQPGRWPRALVAVACAIVVAMYATNTDMGGDPTSPRGDGKYRPVLARGDGHMLYLMARSTALDGDWRFDNDLARFGDPWGEPRTATGRKSIVHPIGPALVWTPMIWLAEGGAVVANVFGADIPLHGYTLWHQRIVFLSSALFACGAVLLGRRIARRALGAAWAPSYAAAAVLLGTSLTYYATYMPSYAHAMDAFACAGFLAYWAETIGRRDLRRWIALGALLGVAALIRVQELAMGVVVACEIAAVCVREVRARAWRTAGAWVLGGAAALAVAVAVLAPQFAEWKIVFGTATALPQGARFTRPDAPMIMELLFSSRNGWFSTTPIAYAGVLGLFALPRRARLVAVGLLAAVALQIYLNSTVLDWWSGASFGQRRLCSATLPVVVGLAALGWRLARLAARWRVPRGAVHGALAAVLGIFVAWNLDQVGKLTSGKPAPSEPGASCCGNVPRPLRGAARWAYDKIGNPFQFPANAIFAIRHGVPMSRWDIAVGAYPMMATLGDLRDDARFYQTHGAWKIGAPGFEPWLVGGWSAPQQDGPRHYRALVGDEGTVLVPNLMPNGQHLTLWLASPAPAHAVIRWNGRAVAEADLTAAWAPVAFDLPEIEVHTNELTIAAAAGAKVSDLEMKLLPPPR
jgi:hypothetical protein